MMIFYLFGKMSTGFSITLAGIFFCNKISEFKLEVLYLFMGIRHGTPKSPMFGVRERDNILTAMTYFDQALDMLEKYWRSHDGAIGGFDLGLHKDTRELLDAVYKRTSGRF